MLNLKYTNLHNGIVSQKIISQGVIRTWRRRRSSWNSREFNCD